MTNKKGRRWGIVTLDDKSGRVDVRLFPDLYDTYEPLLQSDKILYVKGEVSFDEFSGGNTMTVRSLLDITDAREQFVRALSVTIEYNQQLNRTIDEASRILEHYRGGTCPLEFNVQHEDLEVALTSNAEWYVTPSDQLLHELRQCMGEQNVKLMFS